MFAFSILFFLIDWAIILGVPAAYAYVAFKIASFAAHRTRVPAWAFASVLLAPPVGWGALIAFKFWQACSESSTYAIHETVAGADGMMVIGQLAQRALLEDIRQEDGYLYFDTHTGYRNYGPSTQTQRVENARSQYVFEISEPRPLYPSLLIHESRFTVKDLKSEKVLAEGRDVLLGGWLLNRLYRRTLRAQYYACTPGLKPGPWRTGRDRPKPGAISRYSDEREPQFVLRDREFVRSALIPARSSATAKTLFPGSVHAESRNSFRMTVYLVMQQIAASGKHRTPMLSVNGIVPAEYLGSTSPPHVQERALEARLSGGADTDLEGAELWADIGYTPKAEGRSEFMRTIRVIQKPGTVLVKPIAVAERGVRLNTQTLAARIEMQEEMNAYALAAAAPMDVSVASAPIMIESSYSYAETIERVKEAFSSSDYRVVRVVDSSEPHFQRAYTNRILTIFVQRNDAEIMSRAFQYLGVPHEADPATIAIKVVDERGRISVVTSGQPVQFIEKVAHEAGALTRADVRRVLVAAIAPGSKPPTR